MSTPFAATGRLIFEMPIVSAEKRFGRYKGEEERLVGTQKLDKDPMLEKMEILWHRYTKDKYTLLQKKSRILLPNNYRDPNDIRSMNMHFSSDEIRKIAIALGVFVHEKDFSLKAGNFLSDLINFSKDEEFTIHTAHLPPLVNLGARNRKSIKIEGYAGFSLGNGMQGGTIIVNGDAGDNAGTNMNGGIIVIEGNAGDYPAYYMDHGALHIKGNAGNHAGYQMKGGYLEIEGNAGDYLGDSMIDILQYSGYSSQGAGKIIVQGNSGNYVGCDMKGGEIHVNGEMGSIFEGALGWIFHKGNEIRPGVGKIIIP